MHAPATKVLLGTASYAEAQALKRKLEGHAVEVALHHNQATCGGGCSVKLEIWANAADVDMIGRILGDEQKAMLERMGYDPNLAAAVFDVTQAEATCPACATRFATTSNECPECGLCFGPVEGGAKKGCGTC